MENTLTAKITFTLEGKKQKATIGFDAEKTAEINADPTRLEKIVQHFLDVEFVPYIPTLNSVEIVAKLTDITPKLNSEIVAETGKRCSALSDFSKKTFERIFDEIVTERGFDPKKYHTYARKNF